MFFLAGMGISSSTGCCPLFLLYWMRHTATPRTRIVTRRRCLMDFIITFCGSVAASMISHYLCKWLDRKTWQCLISLSSLVLWTRRTPKRSRTSFGGSFFYAYGIITFAYPYLSTISRLRQRSSLPFQSHASSSWAVENEISVTPMRAASPPRQMERENEMIVISHRLFLMGMGISPFTGYCLSFLLY